MATNAIGRGQITIAAIKDGASAKVVVVNSEATAFIYKDDFKTLVGPQSIKLTASLQGTSGYQWSYKTPSMTSFANIAGGTSATYVLSNSFFTEKSCTLRCTSGGVHDEVTIVKVSSGSNGNSYSNNMLTGTQDWSDWFIYNSFAQDGVYKDLVVMHGNSSGITESYIELHKNPLTLEADTVYTMSVWAKGSGKFYTYCRPSVTAKILNIDGVDSTSTAVDTKAEHTLTSEWKRYYVVFQTKSGAELTDKYLIAARLFKGNDEIWVAGAKLEKGNNPNPEWSPAASEMVGHDAYTVLLSNESHIFEGDTTKAVAASTSSEVIAYKGATLAAATIGTITGAPTGMTATVQNNGTTSAKFTVAVTTALTTRHGVLTVPVTVDGKAFTQKFSWSLSLKGKDGKGIVSVNEFYAVNNDAANAPADAAFVQSPMPQTSPTNRYLWNYEDTTYSDNSHTRTDKAIIGVHGSNGEDGASITAVTNHYLASASATGVTVATAGWTADASATAATMTNAKPYLWNYEEITYSKGNPTRTAPHVVGRMGRGVSKIEEEYYLSTSQTQLSGGEWKSEADKPVWVPGKYMWTRTKVTYTDGTSEYTGVVCATGGTGTSVLAQYSADGVNWHPSYAANDIWMRTSSDGGTMWTPGMRIVGANYSPNLLKDKYTATISHISTIEHGVQIVPTGVDTYFIVYTDDGVNLTDYIGKDITISLDCEGLAAGQKYVFYIGNKTANAIEVHNGHNVNTIKLAAGSTFSNGFVVFDDSVRPAATSTPVKITRACITSGANPAQQWVPAASEMEGTEGKWRKFQWAKNTSTTSEPTSGWQDTPMTAPSGEYVWMRSGLVVPPATNPAKWDAAVRITGDSGKDGSDVYLLDLSNEVAGIVCDATGAVTGSYPTVTAIVYRGGSRVPSGVTFSIPSKTGISTASVSSAGIVTMSGMTADTAEITVQAVVGGVTLQSTISLYKVKPGAAGLSYAVNLLKKSNVVQQTVGAVVGGYEWDEHPAVGTDCTLTICGKVGPKDNYIELYQNKGYHKIGNFEGRTETVKSFKFKVTEVAGRTTLVNFYRNPDDGDFDSGTYIKWAVITLGDAPQTCWTPAKSEMEGARVFSLQPSTDSVSRNAMGVLSAATVSATKYMTTGDGMATTTEHYLYYRRDSESGTSAWTLGAGAGSPTTTQIDILEDTRAVVFELRDSSGMVLDRERVPVISDAAGIKVGGTNLLRNSDFIDGLKYWDNNFLASLNAVTIPERNAAIGWYDNRFSAKVSHLENSQTWRKLLQPIEKGRIVPGKTYTLSGFVYIPDKSAMGAAANGSTAYRLRASMCYKLKNDTSNHDDSVIDLMQATEGEWSYMSGRWTAPANLNIEETVELAFYLVGNGEYYVNGWKLEEGNVPTAWNAAPEDTSYLRSALREHAKYEGGLVAATMLNLGITEENGKFRVTAGMNGSTEVRGDRSIAFWAGGDAIDAEKPDDGTPAKIVMRHDGTAYFCDNTVRLDASRMEIGEEGSNKLVVLDKDGLKLIDGNEQRLRVVHQSVGTLASAVDSNAVTLNTTEDIRVRRTRHKEVTTISNSGTTKVVGSFTKNFNIGSSNLPVGATVNITASIYSEFPLINDDMEGFPLLGTNARLQIYERQSGTIIFDKKAPLGYDGDKWKDHWAKISANVTIPKAGEYCGNLMLEGDGTEGPTYEMTVATATAKVEGSVQLGFSNQTVLGNDGLLTKWNETAWLVRSGEVHAKVGTTEFVVLPNGIKAIVGGRTIWLAQ